MAKTVKGVLGVPDPNAGVNKMIKTAQGLPKPTVDTTVPKTNSVYWVGQDGNVWVRGPQGTINAGKQAYAGNDNSYSGALRSGYATRINDPNPGNPQQRLTADTTGNNTGAGSGPTYTDTTAARGATESALGSLGTVLQNNLRSIQDRFAQMMGRYADEEATNKQAYDTQMSSNETTRSRTTQSALLAAAQGNRGLRGVLGSMGALGGGSTGELLARRAVAGEANKDIGAGNEVFDNNASQLMNSYATTQTDERNRRSEAEAAKFNEEQGAKQTVAKERQSLFSTMADLWNQAGNTGEAGRYTGMVGSLSPEIASYTATQTAPYTPRSAVFNPGQLAGYLAGRNDMTVKVKNNSENAALNSPISALSSRRKEELV